MKSIFGRLLLSSIFLLVPLIVEAQTDDSSHSVELTAHDQETGEAYPPQDGKAPIVGTPGDGVRDKFSWAVQIRTPDEYEEPGTLVLEVFAFSPEMAEALELGSATRSIQSDDEFITIQGDIDLTADSEFGQMLRYVGRLDFGLGKAAEFDESLTVGCECPRAGEWTGTNYPGTMVCTGPYGITLPLPGGTQTATLSVDDGCRSLYVTNFDAEYADLRLERVPGECGYEGDAYGVPMESEFKMDIQNEEFIIGSLSLETAQQGVTCVMSREFEARFND